MMSFLVTGGEVFIPSRLVLLVGHSFICWAEKFALSSGLGRHLGLSPQLKLVWRGQRGMKWKNLFKLLPLQTMERSPDAIIFHLGGNDLTVWKGKALIERILGDLQFLKEHFPETLLVWSEIIPRICWRAPCDPRLIDRARRGVNREVGRAMRSGLGAVICHRQLRVDRPEFYRSDGVHLSDAGNAVFLENIQRGLRAEILRPGWRAGGE